MLCQKRDDKVHVEVRSFGVEKKNIKQLTIETILIMCNDIRIIILWNTNIILLNKKGNPEIVFSCQLCMLELGQVKGNGVKFWLSNHASLFIGKQMNIEGWLMIHSCDDAQWIVLMRHIHMWTCHEGIMLTK